MQDCRRCGVGITVEEDPRLIFCYATKRLIPAEQQLHGWQCLYYMQRIIEDGKPLSPEQHYLLKQAELDNKK
ncbi:hypothetical protein [Desulfofundulus thermosubterraneus]|uniref:Uncharacterized protein n=1 Tax=Desulfofundulus thermosubterraneus DSM 16057 TaxID=1121432 RepID=A0A1M6MIS4_9FIRM|nr:hypothetical protein [Desulfofundulus thermosubterraneus]SHJ83337.1 hypothetical protein SAMN02745219_03449 [Desulfofundulus thermosubterraneus DSM 16057]